MMLLHLKVEEHPHFFPREGGLPVGPPQLGKTSSRLWLFYSCLLDFFVFRTEDVADASKTANISKLLKVKSIPTLNRSSV